MNIEPLDFDKYGWKWCPEKELVVPVWFKGDQYPPEFSVKKKKTGQNEGDADDEMEKIVENKKKKAEVGVNA